MYDSFISIFLLNVKQIFNRSIAVFSSSSSERNYRKFLCVTKRYIKSEIFSFTYFFSPPQSHPTFCIKSVSIELSVTFSLLSLSLSFSKHTHTHTHTSQSLGQPLCITTLLDFNILNYLLLSSEKKLQKVFLFLRTCIIWT